MLVDYEKVFSHISLLALATWPGGEPIHAISTRNLRRLCDPEPRFIVERIQWWDGASFDFSDIHRGQQFGPLIFRPNMHVFSDKFYLDAMHLTTGDFTRQTPGMNVSGVRSATCPWWKIIGIFFGNVQPRRKFGLGHFISLCSVLPLSPTFCPPLFMLCLGTFCHLSSVKFNFGGIDSEPRFSGLFGRGAMLRFLTFPLLFNL